METELKTCPCCGGNSFKKIVIKDDAGKEHVAYECEYCRSFIDPDKVQYHSNGVSQFEQKKSNSNSYNGIEIFNSAIQSTINLFVTYGDKVSCGTGLFIGKHYLITNAHVLENPNLKDSFIYNFDSADGKDNSSDRMFSLEFVAADKKNDLALLRYNGNQTFKTTKLEDITVSTGEKVFAVGNAKGFGLSIVEGLVSNSNTSINNMENMIMFSAPVNHGNSGGPLYNEKKQLIGIVTGGLQDSNSMNYAISVSTLLKFISMCEEKENIKVL